MFEPQDHPNDFQYPGGPPIAPYDAAGWTLAYQMGVQFDRILTAFNGLFASIAYGQLESLNGNILNNNSVGYLLNARANNAFEVVNDLLKAGVEVFRTTDLSYTDFNKGSFFIPASTKSKSFIKKTIIAAGLTAVTLNKRPSNLIYRIMYLVRKSSSYQTNYYI